MIKDATVNRGTGGLDVVQAASVATEIPGLHRLRPTARIDAVTADPPLVVSVTGRARRTALAIIEANVLYHSLRGLAIGSRRVQIGRLRFIRPSRFNLCHHFFKMHSILAAVAARTLSIRHSGVPGRDYLN